MDQIYFCQYSEYFADSSPESDGCRPAPWLWNPDPPQWWPLYIFFTWIGWMSFCPLAVEPRPSTVVTSVYFLHLDRMDVVLSLGWGTQTLNSGDLCLFIHLDRMDVILPLGWGPQTLHSGDLCPVETAKLEATRGQAHSLHPSSGPSKSVIFSIIITTQLYRCLNTVFAQIKKRHTKAVSKKFKKHRITFASKKI